jgi:hypothetical protein
MSMSEVPENLKLCHAFGSRRNSNGTTITDIIN